MYSPSPIIEAIFSEHKIKLTFQDSAIYNMTAIGDCCSKSELMLPDYNQFEQIVGKTLISMDNKRILYNNNLNVNLEKFNKYANYKNNKDDYYVKKFTICKMKFSDGTSYPLLLINTSNGYYNGWLEIEKICDATIVDPKCWNKITLTIIIGLPCSGKTQYMKNFNSKKYDDVLNNLADNIFIQDLMYMNTQKMNEHIIVNDPRLCDSLVFDNFIKILLDYIPKENIDLVLFKNNPELCLKNYGNMDDKRDVIDFINQYKSIYDVNHKSYNDFKKKIIPIWSN